VRACLACGGPGCEVRVGAVEELWTLCRPCARLVDRATASGVHVADAVRVLREIAS
jgi:hypothetical protein